MKKQQVLRRTDEGYLRLPYEHAADMREVTLWDETGMRIRFLTRLSVKKADLWMAYPLPAGTGKELTVETEGDCWLRAACLTREASRETLREPLRPLIHHAPATGSIKELMGLMLEEGVWRCSYLADPVSLEEKNEGVLVNLESADLLHWRPSKKTVSAKAAASSYWRGDVAGELSFDAPEGRYVLARTVSAPVKNLAASSFLSLPAICRNGGLEPAKALSNLRVWERRWRTKDIEREFYFEMRFGIGPDVWPEIKILDKDGTSADIRTDACEAELELFVGQEREIEIDFCGAVWKWEALTQTMHCGCYEMPVKAESGRVKLHFFGDAAVQERFTGGGEAMLVVVPEGTGEAQYKIKSELVENINNASFRVQYYKEPYLKISAAGTTAAIAELKVYGLRPAGYSAKSRALLKGVERGEVLYKGKAYTVFENCVEDSIYGDPPAWALHGGKTVLSPVRAVEEFQWRETPWGDMTRIVDRGEKWEAERQSAYPKLTTPYPAVTAAYKIAADILDRNLSPEFALPGQKGLMNAALFQGPGEGFGIWVRDACHSAFRVQNLLAPGAIRESLAYISERGFNNGVDSGAMPAIAIWDHYVATGDHTLLYETLPGVLRYAEEADRRFVPAAGLMDAKMCPAQDAFEEPENGGYCLGTEILYALMYQCTANICKTLDAEPDRRMLWEERGKSIMKLVKERYWNEEAGCFCSGPAGSLAYEKGWWEATGAELSLWPRFGVADARQTRIFLQTIQNNPKALSDYGVNWYPFQTKKNHFWNACWVSWTLGMAVAAAEAGELELLRTLIFQQVRNALLNKTFHEVIDNDTGRAWRWPGLPWHAAAFMGYFVYGIFGVRYDEKGLSFKPAVPYEFRNLKLEGLKYRKAEFTLEIEGYGKQFTLTLDGQPFSGHIGLETEGRHLIRMTGKQE